MIAMVGLTAAVWLRMYWYRLDHVRRKRVSPDHYQTRETARDYPTRAVWASDNLMNLFEMPVLFYAAVLTAYTAGATGSLVLGLAWAYVALRALHSVIHVVYNRVVHRFLAYVTSSVVLFVLWGVIAVQLINK
jgi:hypothetical protein